MSMVKKIFKKRTKFDSLSFSNSGYSGSECQLVSCDGVNYCSNHGNCVGPNQCQCASGWTFSDCSVPICNGCPTNGICYSPGNCQCPPGTFLPNCLPPPTPLCEGADNCTGEGICLGADICVCETGWDGFNCSIRKCFLKKIFFFFN